MKTGVTPEAIIIHQKSIFYYLTCPHSRVVNLNGCAVMATRIRLSQLTMLLFDLIYETAINSKNCGGLPFVFQYTHRAGWPCCKRRNRTHNYVITATRNYTVYSKEPMSHHDWIAKSYLRVGQPIAQRLGESRLGRVLQGSRYHPHRLYVSRTDGAVNKQFAVVVQRELDATFHAGRQRREYLIGRYR